MEKKHRRGGGRFCAIALCNNSYGTAKVEGKSISFHRFPFDVEQRNKWIGKCKRSDRFDPSHSVVCSEHFKPDDFERDLRSELLGQPPKHFLKPGVIPSLKIPSDPDAPKIKAAIQRKERYHQQQLKLSDEMYLESALSGEPSTSNKGTDPGLETTISDQPKSPNYELLFNELQTKYAALEEKLSHFKSNMSKKRRQKLANDSLKKTKFCAARKEIRTLKKTVNKLKKENKLLLARKEADTKELNFFTRNERMILSKEQTKVRWTSNEISKAFTLQYLSKKAYLFARETMRFPLPGISSLQSWAKNLRMKMGILPDVLMLMELVGKEVTEIERLTVLMFDEMQVESLLEYDQGEDEVFGPFSQLQVIMARGLCASWKQPVYVGFDKKITKDILTDVVKALQDIGYIVIAVTSDMGGGNLGLIKEPYVSFSHSHFSLPGVANEMVYFPDAPHLLKLTRNWLVDTGFIADGKEIRIKPVEKLIEIPRSEINVCHKLTLEHINCQRNLRQNVKLAAQLLSHSTATALKHYFANDEEEMCTAQFIEMVNMWFDLMNVRIPCGDLTPFFQAPYGHIKFLSDQEELLRRMYNYFFNMRCIGKNNLQTFQKGVLMSITSMRKLYSNVSNKYFVTYILTSKLNQDSLENLFSQIRSRGGLNDHPTPLNAIHRHRMIILGKNPGVVQAKPSTTSLAEEEFLVAKVTKSIGFGSTSLEPPPEDNKTSSETETASESFSNPPSPQRNIMPETSDDGLVYLAGWIAKKLMHKCQYLGSRTSLKREEHSYSLPPWISHLSYGGLILPTENFETKVKRMERLFIKKFKTCDYPQGKNAVKRLVKYMEKRMDDILKEAVILFCRQRIFIRIKYINNNFGGNRNIKNKIFNLIKLKKTLL